VGPSHGGKALVKVNIFLWMLLKPETSTTSRRMIGALKWLAIGEGNLLCRKKTLGKRLQLMQKVDTLLAAKEENMDHVEGQ
jgi:hypothetical protein